VTPVLRPVGSGRPPLCAPVLLVGYGRARAFVLMLKQRVSQRALAATCCTVRETRAAGRLRRAGVLSSRAIAAEELDTLLRLLGKPSERQRGDLRRATDIVLVEEGKLIYWPRTGEQFADAGYAVARVQATLA
jgi:hypothetical protein